MVPMACRSQDASRFVVFQDGPREFHETIASTVGVGVGHAACCASWPVGKPPLKIWFANGDSNMDHDVPQ